ncbi:MAG: phosphatidylserine decarboxylase family protein [Flavobacteriales bacterium]|jgi:phosphatidylserine decarboxylase|nr:phosphatidylserine decarboxylase family protein [Flavobacteriales bacterium]MBK6753438.1 phosphatidylserine decarboxylase family protein [Flavobacteriales bacterium]MBK7084240.1 phosphatidylserine decarboxylase family protein [Flavobacteriales bacterium]MBK7271172.1 phosphatidylserine decarboxylase family protein [Flavobacteriales bacterium]MBK7753394.1 phosphatidylserine decarboxylase family protein [Flavobacteriales bacterium]
MGIHREAASTLLLASALLCFALYGLCVWNAPITLRIGLAIPLLAIWVIVVLFFRVPHRVPTRDETAVVAPADGKVVAIERVRESEHLGDDRIQVSIFMSPLNVHVNWYPIGGTVSYFKYHPGKYLVAWHPKSSTENERSTVVVRHPKHGDVLFRQIAGALARRICTYSEPNAAATQGGEFGFIKFGSRVDVLLPLNTRIAVALGDKVQGATTVIARFDQTV